MDLCIYGLCLFFSIKMKISRCYPAETMIDADYANDQVLLANTPPQAEFLLHCPEQAAKGIGLYMNANKKSSRIINKEPSPP